MLKSRMEEVIEAWLEQADIEARMPLKAAYASYETYCAKVKTRPVSKLQFSATLRDHGIYTYIATQGNRMLVNRRVSTSQHC